MRIYLVRLAILLFITVLPLYFLHGADTSSRLEVHFFDFDGDLYGQRLEVEFVAKLRDESHFASIEQLVVQMRRDESEARAILECSQRPA